MGTRTPYIGLLIIRRSVVAFALEYLVCQGFNLHSGSSKTHCDKSLITDLTCRSENWNSSADLISRVNALDKLGKLAAFGNCRSDYQMLRKILEAKRSALTSVKFRGLNCVLLIAF